MKRRTLATVALVLAACSDRDGGDGAEPDPTIAADVAFCEALADTADQPVPDPFEQGLPPDQVRDRFREVRSRFEDYERLAPPSLAEQIDALAASLRSLDRLLADAGYDFTQLAESEADVAVFDDPAFTEVAEELAAYRRDVCDL